MGENKKEKGKMSAWGSGEMMGNEGEIWEMGRWERKGGKKGNLKMGK